MVAIGITGYELKFVAGTQFGPCPVLMCGTQYLIVTNELEIRFY